MNTIRSVWYGWGVLIVAGGGAYYFAKKSINADRAERAAADRQRKAYLQRLENDAHITSPRSSSSRPKQSNTSQAPATGSIAATAADGWRKGDVEGSGGGNPSIEASEDPAPTRHAPLSEGQRTQEKSKYEASEPFRSKKGDRFSGI
ncbi:hypothetical protein W97_08642 [Coniosporium apollinis CBS 100218]|uniref:Uncharacterized protein n=1 Tax=Coniosporium apollinis (strain CBS 100218) TaxID=1168221 RepID=R7Z5D1_CONA1|nr:uncharacterized protein W97_08642 [Coniosporium apollinis CBS 100218]EON69382.1 hypothetical protein W97_08642 [Coniosporium apollinis CBS 100218]